MARARHVHPAPVPNQEQECPLCERPIRHRSSHHLVPVAEGGRHLEKILVCRSCHDAVHAILDNKTLAREYRSVEALRAHPVLSATFRFIARQSPETAIRTRRPASRRRRR